MQDLTQVLADYKRKGRVFDHISVIRSGKEAVIYSVEMGREHFALKVYKNPEERAFQKQNVYLEGKYYDKPSVRKAVAKGNRFAKKFTHGSWVKREYSLLKHLNKLGAAVPKVYDWTPGSILMEFIGSGIKPAPRLVDTRLSSKEAARAYKTVLDTMHLLLRAGVVHSDLSAYNILWWKQRPYIIDFPQAIDICQNPNVEKLLKRDVHNVVKYFQKYVAINSGEAYNALANATMDRGSNP